MHKTMAATALSFLLALGGGVALANSNSNSNSNSGHQGSSSTQGSQQQGTEANPKATQPGGQVPVGFAEEEVTSGPFTVQSVDKKNRNLVLRAPDGTQSTVNIPSGTPGFDPLKKGDKVQLDYFAAAVFGPGNQQGNGANQNGSMQGSSSGQANTGANNHVGKVRNIRKVNDTANTGNSGGAQDTGAQGSGSRTNQGNQ